jgi:hypothetical protein
MRMPRLARSAVAAPDVEDAPLGVPTAGCGIECEIAKRMNARVELHAHQLARGTFERRVRRLRIGPLDQDAFALNRTRRRDRGRCRIPADIQSGNVRIVRQVRTRQRRILHVDRVELAVSRVVRIELNADESTREAGFECELVEEARVSVAAVEVEIGRQCPAGFVEDVQRPVQVVHEQPIRAARLLAQRVDAREHSVGLALAVDEAGHRHRDEVFDRQRDLRRSAGRPEGRQGHGKGDNPEPFVHTRAG